MMMVDMSHSIVHWIASLRCLIWFDAAEQKLLKLVGILITNRYLRFKKSSERNAALLFGATLEVCVSRCK